MWSLRRASQSLRCMYQCEASGIFGAKSDIIRNVGERASNCNPIDLLAARWIPSSISERYYMGSCSFCSQASISSNENEQNVQGKDGEESVSEVEVLDNDLAEFSENDTDISASDMSGDISWKEKTSSKLVESIITAPEQSTIAAVQNWLGEGNYLDRPVIYLIILNLRRRRMYGKALQFLGWLEVNKQLEFTERDYACRVNLIAKLRGLHVAERYIMKIPKCFRGEIVYRTLLANCVATVDMKKAVKVFNKMRELKLPVSLFTCNQMILLYKRLDKRKVADVLLLMEKENIKYSLFTYTLLIDAKGDSNDIMGMEQLVENMKAEGIVLDIQTRTVLARHYLSAGLKGKAGAVLKDIEEESLKGNRGIYKALLPLHASLGNADEVARIWRICELNPKVGEHIAAIEAWGKLGRIEEAEAVFEKMLQTWKSLSSRPCAALLDVYANHKLVTKGKEFVDRMGDNGRLSGPLVWDALVKLYVEAGELDNADSILEKAIESRSKPLFKSCMAIMDQYSSRGDVHNTEKWLFRMRQSGYTGRLKPYELLLQAYSNAKTPAYGLYERMKADSVFPNKSFAAQLARADAFKQTALSDLFD